MFDAQDDEDGDGAALIDIENGAVVTDAEAIFAVEEIGEAFGEVEGVFLRGVPIYFFKNLLSNGIVQLV